MNLNQLTRSHEWWDYKTPPVLSFAYTAAIMGSTSMLGLLSPAFLLIFVSLIVMAIYASVINDLTDFEADMACGKSNMMQEVSKPIRLGMVFVPVAAIVMLAFYMSPDVLSIVLYLSVALAISLYSFEPFRLKKRGLWGVISCAMAEHLFPTLFAVSIVFYYSSSNTNWVLLLLCSVVSFSYGLRSIMWHQFLDRDNDGNSNIKTFASRTDPVAFKFIPRLLVSLEVIGMGMIISQVNLWLPWIALLLYLLFVACRYIFFKTKVVFVVSPKNEFFQFFLLEFYTVFFPISILLYVALTQQYGYSVLLIHIIFFHKLPISVIKESVEILKLVLKPLLKG